MNNTPNQSRVSRLRHSGQNSVANVATQGDLRALGHGVPGRDRTGVHQAQATHGAFGTQRPSGPHVSTQASSRNMYMFSSRAEFQAFPRTPGFDRATVTLPDGRHAYCVYRPSGGAGEQSRTFKSLEDLYKAAQQ